MTPEIEDLIRKAEKYLHSAEVLRQIGDLDSAASRLYYAMFYCAEALLADRGLTFSSHRSVLAAFAQHFMKTGLLPREMHGWLREAFDKRQVGDYVARTTLEDADIASLQSHAAEFISRARRLLRQAGLAGEEKSEH